MAASRAPRFAPASWRNSTSVAASSKVSSASISPCDQLATKLLVMGMIE